VADRGPSLTDAKVSGLPRVARPYLFAVLAGAVVVSLQTLVSVDVTLEDWLAFAVLASLAAFAELFIVHVGRNQSYQTAIAFLMVATLTLPHELVPLLILVQHIPEWVKNRYPWYIQSFNIANYMLNVFVAWQVLDLADALGASIVGASLAACAAFVLSNHVVLAIMLRLARGLGFRASGLFAPASLSHDLILVSLAPAVIALWDASPWLSVAAAAPLMLVQRSLAVPLLREETRVDAKTGLYNARYFAGQLHEKLEVARRLERPLSLILADLDLLRDINNTYGHLAGDSVLQGVCDIFRTHIRADDLAARFGGEEFAILLPDTSKAQALQLAERLRHAVERAVFEVETTNDRLRATLSLGVASFPDDALEEDGLIHDADLAVYRAKDEGRNCVRTAAGAAPAPVSVERADGLLRDRSLQVMASISAAIDARDTHTAGHSRRVRALAIGIGQELGLSATDLELLGHAASFHDIGKLSVPDSVLLKPGTLDPAEAALMRTHATEGARTIDRLGLLDEAVPAVRHHHERVDGTGYPDGLVGDQIPLHARIIHVADALDAMVSARVYRPAKPVDAALAEIRREAGRQFCPRCVEALERHVARLPQAERNPDHASARDEGRPGDEALTAKVRRRLEVRG
jgi:diguanylate cyclase (GGDEF)-like protein/putative nucleotidyltransferase with HDIG domain